MLAFSWQAPHGACNCGTARCQCKHNREAHQTVRSLCIVGDLYLERSSSMGSISCCFERRSLSCQLCSPTVVTL